jgi:hypothetical protein
MRTIQWVDRDGKKEPLRSQHDAYTDVAISPDGKRVSFGITGPTGQDLWVYDLQRDALTRLTFGGVCFSPVWTPDGEFIVFGAIGKGIYWTRADGAGQPQPLIQSKHWQQPFSITGEGKRLAYSESVQNGQIWTVSLQEQSRRLIAGEPEQFLKSLHIERVGEGRGICETLSIACLRSWRQVADLQQRRAVADLVADQARVVIRNRTKPRSADDGKLRGEW